MSTKASLYFALAIRDCVEKDPVITKSLAELGLQRAHVTLAHQKGTNAHQVNLCFDLMDGDNIEGIARKFGIGVLSNMMLPNVMAQMRKTGIAEKPVTEFFCVPQTALHPKDSVVATFLFQ